MNRRIPNGTYGGVRGRGLVTRPYSIIGMFVLFHPYADTDGGISMTNWAEFRVLITGGTRGIGFATARLLTQRGATVAIVGTDQARADEAARRLAAEDRPGRAYGIGAIIDGKETTGQMIVERARECMGPLTALVNAAGGATVGHALELPWDVWQMDFDVKLWGYFSVIRAAVPDLSIKGGVIVNILGVAGKDPNPRLAPSTAVNGALRGLTKILADDLAPLNIRVVAVNPGATETDLLPKMAAGYAKMNGETVREALARMRAAGPLGRLPAAPDIAATVVFLMSEDAALITGTSIDIDGGVHRGPA